MSAQEDGPKHNKYCEYFQNYQNDLHLKHLL